MYNYHGMTALVTGASRGIGSALAWEAARRGVECLVLVSRAEDELQTFAGELRARYPVVVEVIAQDLTPANAPANVKAETDRRGLTIDILINNAGFGSYGLFSELPTERERGMIDLNVAALVTLTGLYLPGMVERDRGGVLNVSSTAAFQPVPFMATYGATKAFVQSFTEAIWAENQERGGSLNLTALCPGGTKSNFGANLGAARGKFEKTQMMSAEDVAGIGWDGWERGEPFIVAGIANYLGTFGARVLPRAALARMTAAMFRPADLTPRKAAPPSVRHLALGAAALGIAVLGVRAFRPRR